MANSPFTAPKIKYAHARLQVADNMRILQQRSAEDLMKFEPGKDFHPLRTMFDFDKMADTWLREDQRGVHLKITDDQLEGASPIISQTSAEFIRESKITTLYVPGLILTRRPTLG